MIKLLRKIFSNPSKRDEDFVSLLSTISNLTHSINRDFDELQQAEKEFMFKYADEFFISLKDLTKFSDTALTHPLHSNLSIPEFLLCFKHISELKPESFSIVSLYTIVDETGHLVLCTNPSKCSIHKDYKGDPICIITAKRNSIETKRK